MKFIHPARTLEEGLRTLILILCLSVAASCAGSTSPEALTTVESAALFPLRGGQEALLESTGLRVRLLSVPEDSRCPSDVQCVWAGDARVHLLVTNENDAKEDLLELHTGVEPRSATLRGYQVELIGLEPTPRSTGRIEQEQYVAELRITPAR